MILWPVKAIFEKSAVMVEVDTFTSPILCQSSRELWPRWLKGQPKSHKRGAMNRLSAGAQTALRRRNETWTLTALSTETWFLIHSRCISSFGPPTSFVNSWKQLWLGSGNLGLATDAHNVAWSHFPKHDAKVCYPLHICASTHQVQNIGFWGAQMSYWSLQKVFLEIRETTKCTSGGRHFSHFGIVSSPCHFCNSCGFVGGFMVRWGPKGPTSP